MPAPRRTGPSSALARGGVFERAPPARLERLQAGNEPGTRFEHLAGRRGIAHAERVLEAKLQPVHAEPGGEVVHQCLVGDGGLRHAEAAKRAGRRSVGVDGPAPRRDSGHGIGAGGMDRHAACHGRPPGGIGASIEGGVERDRLQLAVTVAAETRLDRRGMALGARHHALRPLVDAGDRRAGEPGGERCERLDRDVELATEAAAAGARHDPHLRRREAKDLGCHVPVHDRRLRRDPELDTVAHATCPAGLGLDIGVLDEGGLEAAFSRHGRARERRFGIAALDPALDQAVILHILVDQGCVRLKGSVQAAHRRRRLVADRQVLVPHRDDRLARAHQRHHGVAPVTHDFLGQHRLVAQVGIDADAVGGHVGGGEHARHAGPRAGCRRDVAEHDPRRLMRRPDDPEPECVRRHGVGAVALGTGELGHAVELGKPGADGRAGRGRGQGLRGIARRVEHRGYDLAIAGAAAEDAAEAIHDLRRAGARAGAQQPRSRRPACPACRRRIAQHHGARRPAAGD